MGLLDMVDNFLTFILSRGNEEQQTKNRENYIKYHPAIKSKKKEVEKQLKKAGESWSKAKRMRAELEEKQELKKQERKNKKQVQITVTLNIKGNRLSTKRWVFEYHKS